MTPSHSLLFTFHFSLFSFNFSLSLFTFLFSLFSFPLFSSCQGKRQPQQENQPWQPPVRTDTLLALEARQESNTIEVAGHQLSYSCSIAPDTLLAIVSNQDGQRYYDNTATLTIHEAQNLILRQTFTKEDFAYFVPNKEMEFCVLAGLTYDELANEQHHDALRFIATVGDPDEANGINFPVEIVVRPNGHLTLEQAEDLETAPLTPGLSEQPDK